MIKNLCFIAVAALSSYTCFADSADYPASGSLNQLSYVESIKLHEELEGADILIDDKWVRYDHETVNKMLALTSIHYIFNIEGNIYLESCLDDVVVYSFDEMDRNCTAVWLPVPGNKLRPAKSLEDVLLSYERNEKVNLTTYHNKSTQVIGKVNRDGSIQYGINTGLELVNKKDGSWKKVSLIGSNIDAYEFYDENNNILVRYVEDGKFLRQLRFITLAATK